MCVTFTEEIGGILTLEYDSKGNLNFITAGDNRENSADSRYWNQTFIPEDEIYAKYMFRYSLGKNGWYCDWRDPVDFWAEE